MAKLEGQTMWQSSRTVYAQPRDTVEEVDNEIRRLTTELAGEFGIEVQSEDEDELSRTIDQYVRKFSDMIVARVLHVLNERIQSDFVILTDDEKKLVEAYRGQGEEVQREADVALEAGGKEAGD